MSESFIGEIRMFAGNFAPSGWALCDGQLLSVSQHDALFSLLGTSYGGDGRTTFALPDMRGRIPIHAGSGPGLSPRSLGTAGGSEQETITIGQLPSHGHPLQTIDETATEISPENRMLGRTTAGAAAAYTGVLTPQAMNSESISYAGDDQPHTNLMPYLCIHFIIALTGIYPSR